MVTVFYRPHKHRHDRHTSSSSTAITFDIAFHDIRITLNRLILKLVLGSIIGIRFRLNYDRVILIIAERDLSALVASGIAVLHEVQIIQLSCIAPVFQ